MNTTNVDINADSCVDLKSERTGKFKKAAIQTGKLAGAAGLGVAGTIVAEAMTDYCEESTEEITPEVMAEQAAEASNEIVAEEVADFDPNDIMVEVDEVIDESDIEIMPEDNVEDNNQGGIAMIEPQPITDEEGWGDLDQDEVSDDECYLAENDSDNEECEETNDLDLADDILA